MPRARANNELCVWANGVRVGLWRAPASAPMEFRYDPEWITSAHARPLSLSLPLTPDPSALVGPAVDAYFENLLPDSDIIRKRLQQRFKTPSRDAFDLLAAIGRDCVGAVQLLLPGETPTHLKTIQAQPLDEVEIAEAISHAVTPGAAYLDRDELRISIAGAQEKTALLHHNGRWCRPLGATPTTHIFKLPLGLVGNMRADMSASVENEWLCSKIIEAYGLPIARCDIGHFDAFKVLIVKRFDRQLHSGKKYWLRLMQEDFCQATGTPSHLKYEAEGGPGLRELGLILRGALEPEIDLNTLFKAQFLFCMLAATDGHAKNFSLRLLAQGRYQLTPLYDVLSAWPIIGGGGSQLPLRKAKLAMAIRSKNAHYRIQDIQHRHFMTLAAQLGLTRTAESTLDDLVAATPKVIDAVQSLLPKGFPPRVAEPILQGLRISATRLSVR